MNPLSNQMTLSHSSLTLDKFNLKDLSPFCFLSSDELALLTDNIDISHYKPGTPIVKPFSYGNKIHIVSNGSVRYIGKSLFSNKQVTLSIAGPNEILGWCSLLRADSFEYITAKSLVTTFSFPSPVFIDLFKSNSSFSSHFQSLSCIAENYHVLNLYLTHSPRYLENDHARFLELSRLFQSSSLSLPLESSVIKLTHDHLFLLSSNTCEGLDPGALFTSESLQKISKIRSSLPLRVLGIERKIFEDAFSNSPPESTLITVPDSIPINSDNRFSSSSDNSPFMDFYSLGILEHEGLSSDSLYPFYKGNSNAEQVLAICKMLAEYHNVPLRSDIINKAINEHFKRDKKLSLKLIAGLLELLGLTCQFASTTKDNIVYLQSPNCFFLDDSPVILFGHAGSKFTIADPKSSLLEYDIDNLLPLLPDSISFITVSKSISSPTDSFTWRWFLPLLNKYKFSLLIVFFASLFAQLFGLAIPLLLQQIIDKVITQGNLSTLNVIGSVMIVLALFQGLLQCLRTYVFVDTTDRIDLSLGSAVVDRLLSLPLNYFERRPVGELTQRLGELNTVRSFLTGTALISVLNILFAFIYLVVMFIYSPSLSLIALSTFPVYLFLVIFISPLYKTLLRRRAVAQSKTQSHLIEVLSGIQTVKAQNFELTARWKWQDRYRNYVEEGFKSVALSSTTSEIGNFLNQVSSLVVLWVGMTYVLSGSLTLGQLIAFRIISSNVTSPLLQLSTLYQGYQTFNLALERLGDIFNQPSELKNQLNIDQIALPPISGGVQFVNVDFSFSNPDKLQLSNVSFSIPPGCFVGIVGKSGSGKSTLMKLLPRLYDPLRGRIYIDGYDISKVELNTLRRQIGIVPQDSLLFEGSVASNIALNEPDATTESIIEAARIACAHDFIMDLPDGYATLISERGSNLSGGQRQRIAIARTILSNPRLLVLDEATSALDLDTESTLCRNLYDWKEDRTVFFITHRFSTIRHSDHIIVMDSGSIVEQGDHNTLIKDSLTYKALSTQNFSLAN